MPRNRHLLLGDALLLLLASLGAFAVRYEGTRDLQAVLADATPYLVLTLPLRLGVLWLAGIYRRLWRYASTSDLARLVTAGTAAALLNTVLGAVLLPGLELVPHRVPLAVLALDGAATIGITALLRLAQRERDRRRAPRREQAEWRPVLIAGAGAAGRTMVREIHDNPDLALRPVGFLDDDEVKLHQTLLGLPILGGLDALAAVVERTGAEELIIAMPTAPGTVIRRIIDQAAAIGLPTRTVPGLSDVVSGRVELSTLRKVEIGDLMRRDPIETDLAAVREMVQGKRVLVTGAGGSIGSELCRQLALFDPAQMALLGHGENSIYDVHREIQHRHPALVCVPVICDVRERDRMERVFEWFRPELVFHAAAHKHVPLMESNPCEAVTNNVLGTRVTAELSRQVGAERFLMISTDKVVNPTSVMGATKRLAEQVVQHLATGGATRCSAVRFGNVLGSRGSVVPLFLDQIREGRPITITHPEVRRYFMTIPEAVQLVLQAMTMGKGGEVFALDMGDPVRIADLATDLIRLSGLEPGRDIPIVFTGLRPGEKLFEEVFFDHESAERTEHVKVLRSRMTPPPVTLLQEVDRLTAMAQDVVARDVILGVLRRLVDDYTPPDLLDRTPPQPVADDERITAVS